MSNILDKILTNYHEESILERQKAKVIVVVDIAGFIAPLLLSPVYLLIGRPELLWETLPLSVILLVNFFIIFSGKLKLASIVLTSGLIIFLSIVVHFNLIKSAEYNFFMNEFYIYLFLITLSTMVNRRGVLIFNALYIVVSSVVSYVTYREALLPSVGSYSDIGIIEFIVMVILAMVLGVAFINFISMVVKQQAQALKRVHEQEKLLNGLMVTLNNSSDQITSSSIALSGVSGEVSQRNSEMASTTEEVSASTEEMVSTINMNADYAEESKRKVLKTAESIIKYNEIISATVELVNKISKEITVISDIANKTDILSINAAIEAAKAENEGGGFAVVAEEIRKLSDRSNAIAKNIKDLSTKGKASSQIAHKALSKMIPEIKEVATIIENIASASKEQINNAENINNSMLQLSEISSSNSATSEEMASSAEELSTQAEQLRALVQKIVKERDKVSKEESVSGS